MRRSSTQSNDEERSKQAKAKNDLSQLFLRFSHGDDCLQGFAGTWTFYRAESADDSDINSSFRCLRTYEAIGNDPVSIYFRTFNENEPPNRKAAKREQDGLYESGHSRPANDPFFSEVMVLSDAERREGLPECTFWRCAAIDPQVVIRIAPRLPPNFMSSSADALSRYPGWSPQSIAMGVFAFESFIEEGSRRWSMGALYSVHSSRLLSHFCILERAVEVQPKDKIDFDMLPFVQAREKLNPQANTWLEGGRFKGEMEEIVWDEDGDQMRLPTRPANWTPPPKSSTTHRLFLYKDSMYAYYPIQLPAVSDDLPNAYDAGARFEMGGTCCDDQIFRRLILRYSPAGHVSSLTRELYKAQGSFEHDRRASISMRRSHGTHPSPQSSSRRLNARVANLEKAMAGGEAPPS